MTWIAAAIIGSTVIGAGASLLGGSQQASAVEQGTQQSIDEQRRQFDVSQQLTAPLREAEQARLTDEATARNQLLNILGIGDEQVDLTGIQIPGQEFQLSEAQRAIERSAAARGGLVSGGTLDELQTRALGITQQNFLSNFLNPLQNLARPNSAPGIQQSGQSALNLGVNVGNQLSNLGANRANIAGQTVAGVAGAAQGGLSNFLLQNQLNIPPTTGGVTGPGRF